VLRFSALIACTAACAFSPQASAAPATTAGDTTHWSIPVSAVNTSPAELGLSTSKVVQIANALPKVRAVCAKYPGFRVAASGENHVRLLYYGPRDEKPFAEVVINRFSGRVIEQWTSPIQVAWVMARGYPTGWFGGDVNELYIWLPLCALFILPFLNFRRPFSLLHLDLLVLLSFSVSLDFFNNAHIYGSVPLVYPPLLYLLARMLALLRRGRQDDGQAPLRLLVPTPWLAIGVVLLLGFRIGLNLTNSEATDTGYAGVVGAQRIVDGEPLYDALSSSDARRDIYGPIENGDTYGPVNYEAYVPFEQIFGWNGTVDDPLAAQATAIFFDLLTTALLFLLGRRMRGPTLGVALAYAWVSYPFTLFALESDTNDSLLAALVLAAVLAASYREEIATAARGGLTALAGLTKFAPLALAPLLATHGLSELPPVRRVRTLTLYVAAFLGTAALTFIPALSHASLHTIYERTSHTRPIAARRSRCGGCMEGSAGCSWPSRSLLCCSRLLSRSFPGDRGPCGGVRGGAHRNTAGGHLLVLLLYHLVLPPGDVGAAGTLQRALCATNGRRIDTHSIASGRSGSLT